ncbi:MAG: helix-turn-helix domain-containing protein [Alphaproteobacteria bacterium]|jgi:predicted transcriptional regulator/DNA-binding XRE family transcriptional regulator|nr:helix-turn-helix domain-containing protein [Alphaproteobacteria bacterium]
MPERQLTGTRLRNRRIDRGMKQSALAQAVGISPSYLNLIEHNRRRIGGKLLSDIARELAVEPEMLVEGTASAVRIPLQEAAGEFRSAAPEEARIDELVARFPGWAALIGAQHDRIAQLEARVQRLTDRLTHDPQVASALHEVISTVTAIRSTASILVDSEDLDRDWQARFHRNLDTDSLRLSESSQALMGYLDMNADAAAQVQSPLEIAEAEMAARGYAYPELERGEASPEALSADLPDPRARAILRNWLSIFVEDARHLPTEAFAPAARKLAHDPLRLARMFEQPLDRVFRRLAALPEDGDHPVMGLAICDQAGVVVFQKPMMDFHLPRSAAACPFWPVFQALTQPGRPVRRIVGLPGASATAFDCAAVARDFGPPSFDGPGQVVATMLVRPVHPDADTSPALVGPGCRVCPVEGCTARRQPSLLQDGA